MHAIIFALLVSCVASASFAAPVNDMPARTELHAINTLTLSDAQFLSGDANAKATVTTGALRIPSGQGRLPMVVLQHGSGGMAAQHRYVVTRAQCTRRLDTGTRRLHRSRAYAANTNQALLGRLNFVLDIYRALDILAKHPRVDPQRIVLMGFSRGGQAALYASLKRFHKLWSGCGMKFAGYIPLYPDCATSSRRIRSRRPADPHLGRYDDDYNPIALCRAYVARLKAAGRDAQVTEYPTASHAFDNPLGPVPPPWSPVD